MNDSIKILISLILMTLVSQAKASYILVGSDTDASCDTSDLTQAVFDAPSGTTIYIANNQSYEGVSLTILSKSLTLIGGFLNCSSLAPTGRTVLGPGTSRAVNIALGGSTYDVELRNLEITGVNGTGDGAGIRVNNRTRLELHNTIIHGNTTTADGGGIWLNGAVNQRLISHSPDNEIRDNTAAHGGGIYCDDSGSQLGHRTLIEWHAGWIADNVATAGPPFGGGGGVYLFNCQMNLSAGGPDPQNHPGGVVGNEGRHGGGIYLRAESSLNLHANDLLGGFGVVEFNEAVDSGIGGGIRCHGVDWPELARAEFFIHAGRVSDNTANSGAAIQMERCDGLRSL